MEQLWWNVILRISWKYVKKIQVLLNSDKNNSYFACIPMQIYDNMMLNSSEWEMFQVKVVEKIQNTPFLFNKFIPNIMPFKREC